MSNQYHDHYTHHYIMMAIIPSNLSTHHHEITAALSTFKLHHHSIICYSGQSLISWPVCHYQSCNFKLVSRCIGIMECGFNYNIRSFTAEFDSSELNSICKRMISGIMWHMILPMILHWHSRCQRVWSLLFFVWKKAKSCIEMESSLGRPGQIPSLVEETKIKAPWKQLLGIST